MARGRVGELGAERLRRLRLAAQRLSPGTHAADARTAARSVIGVQAQDTRAARLALRSRVPGLQWVAVDEAGLVRTWLIRGTAHLVDADDLPWLHAVFGERSRQRWDAQMLRRGGLKAAVGMVGDMCDVLAEQPLDRSALLAELAARGHPHLNARAINVFVPWAVAHGLIVGLADGRLRVSAPPPDVDQDEALATLAARYLSGYGPAGDRDLAAWSGLPLGIARRALAAAEGLARTGELYACAGAIDADPPPPPSALLLAAFDTTMLGYRTRAPFVAPEHDRNVLPGGGMLRPVILSDGRATGTWRLEGSATRRRLGITWFGRPAPPAALRREARDVAHFLGIDPSMPIATSQAA